MSKGNSFNRSIGGSHGSGAISGTSINRNQASITNGFSPPSPPKRSFGHNAPRPNPNATAAGPKSKSMPDTPPAEPRLGKKKP